jgi:cytochrome b involved in lipid metabolism
MFSSRIYTDEDVKAHADGRSCWISRNGKVYDVTKFLSDHPGGDDLILKFAGEDIGDAMRDKDEHDHSDSAYEMLEEYCIGRLGADAGIVSDGALVCSLLAAVTNEAKIGSRRRHSTQRIQTPPTTSRNASFWI